MCKRQAARARLLIPPIGDLERKIFDDMQSQVNADTGDEWALATAGEAALAMAGPRLEPMLPDRECQSVYEGLYQQHRELYAALRPMFQRSVSS